MAFTLHEVTTTTEEKKWLDVARIIYKDNPTWVCPLDGALKALFDPKKNEKFTHGEAIRWYMTNDNGELVGRIAAFVDYHRAKVFEYPVGGVGYFECIDNQEAANTLFDAGKAWLQARDIKGMDGPVNFGENDRFSGLLVEGFTHPSYDMSFNWPYYEQLYTNYGFQPYYEQFAKHLDITTPMPERFTKISTWAKKRGNVDVHFIDKKQLGKYVEYFREIHADAWQDHEHHTEISREDGLKLAENLKPILVDYFVPFAFIEGEPAGVLLAVPDLNQIFKPLKGKFGLIDKLLFLWRKRNDFAWYRKRKILTRVRVVLIGIKPKYQRLGLESVLTMEPMDIARNAGYEEAELSWVGSFNEKMIRLQVATGSKPGKTYITYRLPFEEGLEVKPPHKLGWKR